MKHKFLFVFLWIGFLVNAQYQNLLLPKYSTETEIKTLYLTFDNLAFFKNNEYFNLIADGYTLPGNKVDLNLNIKPHQNYKLSAGFSFVKYFGTDNFSDFTPYFQLQIIKQNNRLYFGKLYTANRHGLEDEIYAFERQLDKRSIEHGLQHRFKNKHWQTDTWLEWETFIFKGDSIRERLNFGQTTTYKTGYNNWQISIPLQIYLHHRGGQINIRNQNPVNSAIVIANTAIGVGVEKKMKRNTKLGFKYRYLSHQINSDNTEEFIFKSGYAHKWQVYFKKKNWTAYLSYWQGHKFMSPKGNDMFQSVSRRVEKFLDNQGQPTRVFASHTEPNRELLYGTLLYRKEIFKELNLAFVVDVYYQLNSSSIVSPYYNSEVYRQLDYALGLYLNYRFDFKLLDIK